MLQYKHGSLWKWVMNSVGLPLACKQHLPHLLKLVTSWVMLPSPQASLRASQASLPSPCRLSSSKHPLPCSKSPVTFFSNADSTSQPKDSYRSFFSSSKLLNLWPWSHVIIPQAPQGPTNLVAGKQWQHYLPRPCFQISGPRGSHTAGIE